MSVHVQQMSPRVHFVQTDHVNWSIYSGPDGITLIDSGYLGQRSLLEESLLRVGIVPGQIDAVLITHAHSDHLGGASWLASEFGIPVYAADAEVAHVKRERLEQVGVPDVLRNALRPGVLAWAGAIYPLLKGQPKLGVPQVAALPMASGAGAVPGSPIPILVPGHTSGSTLFNLPGEGVVVVGDALVTGHRTSRRTGPQLLATMFHHDEELARASLDRLAEVDAGILLPGHGPAWIGRPAEAIRMALEPRHRP
jgi:glyoxylase-like metal-dependent hydrolase (beta-lactamase superfamily II)